MMYRHEDYQTAVDYVSSGIVNQESLEIEVCLSGNHRYVERGIFACSSDALSDRKGSTLLNRHEIIEYRSPQIRIATARHRHVRTTINLRNCRAQVEWSRLLQFVRNTLRVAEYV